jgi:LETM1 and EF-hand domain-containing protein 1
MAKFLQDTLHESPLKSNAKIVGTEEFKQFFRKVYPFPFRYPELANLGLEKVRSGGEPPSTDDIINVAKLFDDDLTLDNLSRPQLVSVCRYMNVNAFGTDNYLRGQIRGRLERIRKDDAVRTHSSRCFIYLMVEER